MTFRKLNISLIFIFLLTASAVAEVDVNVSKVKRSFTIQNMPETEKEYKTRLENIESILHQYGSNPSAPLLFIGNEEDTLEGSKKLSGGTVTLTKSRSPRFLDVVYRVNSPSFNDNTYIRLNRETAKANVYQLNPHSVKPASSFKSEDRILQKNIQDKNSEHQTLLLTFAKRLIEKGICESVTSGAKYTSDSATLFCGDGMKYTQTLEEITNNKDIDPRVVRSYAVF